MSDRFWRWDTGQQPETNPNGSDGQQQPNYYRHQSLIGFGQSPHAPTSSDESTQPQGDAQPQSVERDPRQQQWNRSTTYLHGIRQICPGNAYEYAQHAGAIHDSELTCEVYRSGQVSLDTPEQRANEWQKLGEFFTHLRSVSPELANDYISRVCDNWQSRILDITNGKSFEDQWQIHRELLTNIDHALPWSTGQFQSKRDVAANIVHAAERDRVTMDVSNKPEGTRWTQYYRFLKHVKDCSQNALTNENIQFTLNTYIQSIHTNEFLKIIRTHYSPKEAANSLDRYANATARALGLNHLFVNSYDSFAANNN